MHLKVLLTKKLLLKQLEGLIAFVHNSQQVCFFSCWCWSQDGLPVQQISCARNGYFMANRL